MILWYENMKGIIKIYGKDYTSEGKDVKECLENLPYKGFSRVISTLTIKDNEKEKSVVLYPRQTQRLFSLSPMMKEIAVKQIGMRFT